MGRKPLSTSAPVDPEENLALADELPHLTLAQRLINLRARVGGIQKRGEFFKEGTQTKLYDYHAADDVMAALRVEMDKLHILSWVEIEEIVGTTVHKFKYSEAYRTTLRLRVHIINADDPSDSMAIQWFAVGVDGVDKDFVKATTLGHKYFWLYLLAIGDGGSSDPDSTPYPEAGTEIQSRAVPVLPSREKSAPELPDGLPPGFTKEHWESLVTMAQELPAKAFVPAPQFAEKKLKARLSAHHTTAGNAEGAYKLMREELLGLLPKDLFSDIPS